MWLKLTDPHDKRCVIFFGPGGVVEIYVDEEDDTYTLLRNPANSDAMIVKETPEQIFEMLSKK